MSVKAHHPSPDRQMEIRTLHRSVTPGAGGRKYPSVLWNIARNAPTSTIGTVPNPDYFTVTSP